jgi:glycosyltransferase involved in cell wall biosynthesis
LIKVKFSILIANYDNGKFFKDCYDSIIAQTYNDWEVVIVDDKSTDDSVSTIRNLIRDDKRFRFYENDKNYGCGYTKRRCAGLAKGEICGFVDPDDTITDDALKKMVNAHLLNPSAAMVYSTFVYCNEKLDKINQYENAMQVKVDEYFINGNANVAPFATFKKEYYNKTVGIAAMLPLAVDQDLYLKLSETVSFYFLDEVLYY